MCGICGAAGIDDPRPVEAMTAVQAHRGPDDSGMHFIPESRLALGHRRLSIIDLSSAGHQPMSNDDGSVWIVLNGEIYNFRELRRELEGRFASGPVPTPRWCCACTRRREPISSGA